MKKIKVGLISLGCEKNLVDSEMILGLCKECRFEFETDLNNVDIIIINTCGFITSAKEEAINTIFEALDYQENGTKIVVTGCLAQRYLEDLKREIPEVDLYIPIKDYPKMGQLLSQLLDDNKYSNYCMSSFNRVLSTPPHLAYLKISEGCNNNCAYCAIPLIRGKFVSKPEEDIITEFKYLVKTGRKEICLISQDLTKYGIDLENKTLASLLLNLLKVEGVYKIRLLYLYPDEITDELIQVIKENDKIYPYFDIPVQHGSDKVLKWMGRRGNQEFINDLIKKIRKEIPESVIRTTLILGFPHESDKDFQILKQFVTENKFDHLGAFTYSKEEDTRGYSMTCQVPQNVKQRRLDEIMEMQKWISLSQNKRYIDNVYDCIIESYDDVNDYYYARGYMYAPDDIDGSIIIKSSKKLELYKSYKCKIVDVDFFDIFGEVVDE